MNINITISDQLFKWSEEYEKFNYSTATKKTYYTCQKTYLHSTEYSQRFLNRTLQTMWEERMQMFRWTWAWAQVLFIGQPLRPKTTNGLHTSKLSKTSGTICGKLQANARNIGRNLQHQSRDIKTQRTTIIRYLYAYQYLYNRYRYGGNYCCQYAPGFFIEFKKESSKGEKQ